VGAFLAEVCAAAARCPSITATPADVAACPAGIKSELSEAKLNELMAFAGYTDSKQRCVLTCIGSAICGRFGGGLGSISDSDVLEPFRTCSASCGVNGSPASIVAIRLWPSPCSSRQLEAVFRVAHAQFPPGRV
jgi:hypothetical protein